MVLIKMTGTDIQLGKRCKGDKCPVTYALMRVFSESKVEVFGSFAFIDQHIIWLPLPVERWIWEWDRKSQSLNVISFELPNPPNEIKFKEYL